MPGQAYLMYPAWFIPIHVGAFLVDQCDSVACERDARAGEVQKCRNKKTTSWGFLRGSQSLMSLQVLNKSYVIVAMRTPAPRCSSPPDRLYRPRWPAGLRASVRGDGHEKAIENEKASYYITLVCAVEAPTTTTSTAAQAPSCAALQPTAAISFP